MPQLLRLLAVLTVLMAGAGAQEKGAAAPAGFNPQEEPDGGGYLVVTVDLHPGAERDRGFLAAAAAAAGFHGAGVIRWGGQDTAALGELLARRNPENVLFVLRPETLDINLHRRILLTVLATDGDPFADHAFGYLTAGNSQQVLALWQRIEQLHREGLRNRTWVRGSVTSSPKSLVYQGSIPAIAKAAGFGGRHFYVSVHDPDPLAFADQHLSQLKDASVIQFTGNGDPQGIWVFPGRRNMERDRHWDYRPELVGHDPLGEMPRITADRFRGLGLASPIVWSGTCHSAAVHRVYVEGDIVSTFGRVDAATVHTLDPGRSMCLAILEAGAAAFLAPIGANHGMAVSMETDFAMRHGASLGETLKATYDDVAMAARGELVLDFPVAGEPHPGRENVMQGGGANRILIGDPALRPFRPVANPLESVEVLREGSGLRVTVRRQSGFVPRAWDMFGRSQPNDWRVIVRVALPEAWPGPGQQIAATVTATSPTGDAMPYAMRHCRMERYHGKGFLHLQANGIRLKVERRAVEVVFHVTDSGDR